MQPAAWDSDIPVEAWKECYIMNAHVDMYIDLQTPRYFHRAFVSGLWIFHADVDESFRSVFWGSTDM